MQMLMMNNMMSVGGLSSPMMGGMAMQGSVFAGGGLGGLFGSPMFGGIGMGQQGGMQTPGLSQAQGSQIDLLSNTSLISAELTSFMGMQNIDMQMQGSEQSNALIMQANFSYSEISITMQGGASTQDIADIYSSAIDMYDVATDEGQGGAQAMLQQLGKEQANNLWFAEQYNKQDISAKQIAAQMAMMTTRAEVSADISTAQADDDMAASGLLAAGGNMRDMMGRDMTGKAQGDFIANSGNISLQNIFEEGGAITPQMSYHMKNMMQNISNDFMQQGGAQTVMQELSHNSAQTSSDMLSQHNMPHSEARLEGSFSAHMQRAGGAHTPPPPAAQVSVQIAKAAADGERSIEINLEPASLGKVQVQMDINADGKASVLVLAERAETLEMLQRDAKALERALAESGMDSSGGSLEFSLQQGSNGEEKFADTQKGSGRSGNDVVASTDTEISEPPASTRYIGNRALDVMA